MEFLDASSSQYNLASDIEEKHRSTEKQENPTFANISSCARVPVDLLPHLSQELLSCKHLYAFSRKEMYLRFAKPTDFGFAKPGIWASSTQGPSQAGWKADGIAKVWSCSSRFWLRDSMNVPRYGMIWTAQVIDQWKNIDEYSKK